MKKCYKICNQQQILMSLSYLNLLNVLVILKVPMNRVSINQNNNTKLKNKLVCRTKRFGCVKNMAYKF